MLCRKRRAEKQSTVLPKKATHCKKKERRDVMQCKNSAPWHPDAKDNAVPQSKCVSITMQKRKTAMHKRKTAAT